MKKILSLILTLFILIGMVACKGQKPLNGKYISPGTSNGMYASLFSSMEFSGDTITVTYAANGGKSSAVYTLENNELRFYLNGREFILENFNYNDNELTFSYGAGAWKKVK